MFKVCVDTGGTFTDCMVQDAENNVYEFKASTTPGHFHEGVLNAIGYGAEYFGKTLEEFMRETDWIIHGTTVATNAVVERKMSKTAMITTKGFRDIIEMRQCQKIETHSLFDGYIPPYEPFIPAPGATASRSAPARTARPPSRWTPRSSTKPSRASAPRVTRRSPSASSTLT